MISANEPIPVTLNQKLAILASPAAEFMKNIRVVEDAAAGLVFAAGWASSPPPAPGLALNALPPMPVSGHGPGREAALNRLMMEAVERSSSVYTGFEPLVHGDGVEFNASIRCTPACSLVTRRKCLIPAATAFLGYAERAQQADFVTDSNGCAAGETLEAAVCRGLLEVIERDAVAIWWFNRVARPALFFDDENTLCAIRTALERERRSLILFDLTHDIGVPVVAALTADPTGGHIYIGAAADTSTLHAAIRAACEMFQFWLWGRISADPPERTEWLKSETTESQPWLKAVRFEALDVADRGPASLAQLTATVAGSGFDPLFVDLTRPWFQIPVVRAVVPGTLSLRRAPASGRLLDVPVKLGWLAERTKEENLMPYPCPI